MNSSVLFFTQKDVANRGQANEVKYIFNSDTTPSKGQLHLKLKHTCLQVALSGACQEESTALGYVTGCPLEFTCRLGCGKNNIVRFNQHRLVDSADVTLPTLIVKDVAAWMT